MSCKSKEQFCSMTIISCVFMTSHQLWAGDTVSLGLAWATGDPLKQL